MAISNINLAMSASSYGAYQQKLTPETAAELRKLGVPFSADISEQEGRALIAQYKAQELKNENSQKNFSRNGGSQKNYLFEKAKNLAEKLGIQVDNNIEFKNLLALIEQKLEFQIKSSQNDINLLKQLKEYSEEFASIKAESMGATFGVGNQALEKSLEMLSLYNKNFLNN